MARCILITGCSGGGKSTLLGALAKKGFATVPEPGRRIVQGASGSDDPRLPWNDPVTFAQTALEMALRDLDGVSGRDGVAFFDRGVLDAAVALKREQDTPLNVSMPDGFPYDTPVFLAPAWQDIFTSDAERQHDFDAAVAEFEAIRDALQSLSCDVRVLPKVSVEQRLSFVLNALELQAR